MQPHFSTHVSQWLLFYLSPSKKKKKYIVETLPYNTVVGAKPYSSQSLPYCFFPSGHTPLRKKDVPIISVESETYQSSISPVFNQKATSACFFFFAASVLKCKRLFSPLCYHTVRGAQQRGKIIKKKSIAL